MQIGDKVRFLFETGGGIVKGFQGKDIVLVEDENGFSIPMLIRECVVIDTNEYNFEKKTVAPKKEEPKKPVKTTVTALRDEEDDFEPVVTYRPMERREGEKLNVALAFVPVDIKQISTTIFEAYLVNDSNYYLSYLYASPTAGGMKLRAQGIIEPNTNRIGIQRIHHFVDLVCVFDFGNILRRCNNPLAVQNGSHLFQTQGILLNSQG